MSLFTLIMKHAAVAQVLADQALGTLRLARKGSEPREGVVRRGNKKGRQETAR